MIRLVSVFRFFGTKSGLNYDKVRLIWLADLDARWR